MKRTTVMLGAMHAMVAVTMWSCGTPVTCPQSVASVTYDDVAPIFKAKCTGCHATTRAGDDRHGAPEDSNYDTYVDAAKDARDAAKTVIDGSMPYGGVISDQDACTIKGWTDQGASP